MRQYIITGMNGAHYYGYSQTQYGPWCQPIQQGYPYHSIWHPSHLHSTILLRHCRDISKNKNACQIDMRFYLVK
ncbi:hypothetical protein [Cytobacillus firmus]